MLVIRNSSNQLVQIDNYRVQSQLTKSDFATLYHVKDLKLEKEYILKFFDSYFRLIDYSENLDLEELVKQFLACESVNLTV